jgi:DNA polymerase III delta prime subunit
MTDVLNIAWYAKYLPKTLDEYVFDEPEHQALVDKWLQNGAIEGNLLLSGNAGIGKSCLAYLLINTLIKSPHDLKHIRSRSVAEIDELMSYIKGRAVKSKKKIILFEEVDKISSTSATTLKDTYLEAYQNNVTFIATTNYPNKLDPALKSRFIHLTFSGKNIDGIIERCKTILQRENVIFEEEQLKQFINTKHKLGLRNILTLLQVNSINNKIDFTNISQEITSSEEDIVENTLKIFEILLESDAQNKKLIQIQPLQSNVANQFSFILQTIQFSQDLYWDSIFMQINDRTFFLPIKMLCSKYIEDIEKKRLPHLHFIAFLYEAIKTISELY